MARYLGIYYHINYSNKGKTIFINIFIIHIMTTYYKMRIFISEDSQKLLFPSNNDNVDKIKLFEMILKQQIELYEVFHSSKKNKTILLSEGNYGSDGSIESFNISVKTDVEVYEKDDKTKKIKEELIDSFPYIRARWYRKEQLLYLEKKAAVVPNISSLIDTLQDLFDILFQYEKYSVHINAITSPTQFWDTIKESQYVYSVSLRIDNPNFFGEDLKNVKEMALEAQELFNSDSVNMGINNTKGELKISSSGAKPFFIAALNWIAGGGGKWEINRKKDEDGRKETVSSSDTNYATEEDVDN